MRKKGDEHVTADRLITAVSKLTKADIERILTKRIRDLEAELASCRRALDAEAASADYHDKRAEKAEASRDANRNGWTIAENLADALGKRLERAEARVRKLAFALSEHRCDWYGDRHDSRFGVREKEAER